MSRTRKSAHKARTPGTDQAPAQHSAHDGAEHPPTPIAPVQHPPTGMPTASADGAHRPPAKAVNEQVPAPPARRSDQGGVGHPPAEEQEQRHGPVWSASEAARRCGIGRATMTRRLQAGEIAGATRNDEGHWQVPLTGLLAAGLRPDRATPPEDDEQDAGDDAVKSDDVATAVELAELRGQLAVERARREAAEQLASERAARIDDLRHVLRALEAPTGPAHKEEPQVKQPAQADHAAARPASQTNEGVAGRLRRWWRER